MCNQWLCVITKHFSEYVYSLWPLVNTRNHWKIQWIHVITEIQSLSLHEFTGCILVNMWNCKNIKTFIKLKDQSYNNLSQADFCYVCPTDKIPRVLDSWIDTLKIFSGSTYQRQVSTTELHDEIHWSLPIYYSRRHVWTCVWTVSSKNRIIAFKRGNYWYCWY